MCASQLTTCTTRSCSESHRHSCACFVPHAFWCACACLLGASFAAFAHVSFLFVFVVVYSVLPCRQNDIKVPIWESDVCKATLSPEWPVHTFFASVRVVVNSRTACSCSWSRSHLIGRFLVVAACGCGCGCGCCCCQDVAREGEDTPLIIEVHYVKKKNKSVLLGTVRTTVGALLKSVGESCWWGG